MMMQEFIIIKKITSMGSIVITNAIIYFKIYFIIMNLICFDLILDLRFENFSISYFKLY